MKKMFVYYSVGTGHESIETGYKSDEVAITEANSNKEAIENFKKWFINANSKNVQLIDLNRKGYIKNMMIISNY